MIFDTVIKKDEADTCRRSICEPPPITCEMDVITAIKTRQSIRKFTSKPVAEDMIRIILSAGLCAPSAKDKRKAQFKRCHARIRCLWDCDMRR